MEDKCSTPGCPGHPEFRCKNCRKDICKECHEEFGDGACGNCGKTAGYVQIVSLIEFFVNIILAKKSIRCH
jgi:hypothetical protein